MAIYIQSEFSVNPNLAKKPQTVVDSSWIYGGMVYASSVDKLPTHKKLVRQGNLGSVPNPANPFEPILYQAWETSEGKIEWKKLKTSGGGGSSDIYYDTDPTSSLTPAEQENLPDDFLVIEDEIEEDYQSDIVATLVSTVNRLEKEIQRIKNTFNDFSAVNITDTTSNYGSYMAFNENGDDFPRIEVDWTDSSNGTLVRNGTAQKYGTASSSKVSWIDSESSLGWYEKWNGKSVSIYSTEVLSTSDYPYININDDGTEPSTNVYADGADEKLTLRHFAPKYANYYYQMNQYKTSLIPYELVLCLEDNALYYYDATNNKMVMLAGADSSSEHKEDPGDSDSSTPSASYETEYTVNNGILNIASSDSSIYVDNNKILNIEATVDEDNVLLLNNVEKENYLSFSINNGILNISSDTYGVSDGILKISGNVDDDENLILK